MLATSSRAAARWTLSKVVPSTVRHTSSTRNATARTVEIRKNHLVTVFLRSSRYGQ